MKSKEVYVVTGASGDIGKAICKELICHNIFVIGIDKKPADAFLKHHSLYAHMEMDILNMNSLLNMPDLVGIINCAGVQMSGRDIEVNLRGSMNVVDKIVHNPNLRCIINICSTSAHNGAEFEEYAASKGGLLTYTKCLAQKLASRGIRVNSISPGGVYSAMNEPVQSDPKKMEACLNETLLHKWATPEDIAKWVHFVACVDTNMTGQDIIIDNGELCKFNFIW